MSQYGKESSNTFTGISKKAESISHLRLKGEMKGEKLTKGLAEVYTVVLHPLVHPNQFLSG